MSEKSSSTIPGLDDNSIFDAEQHTCLSLSSSKAESETRIWVQEVRVRERREWDRERGRSKIRGHWRDCHCKWQGLDSIGTFQEASGWLFKLSSQDRWEEAAFIPKLNPRGPRDASRGLNTLAFPGCAFRWAEWTLVHWQRSWGKRKNASCALSGSLSERAKSAWNCPPQLQRKPGVGFRNWQALFATGGSGKV